jgi:DNA-binding MarR family transcriptional regulator
MKSPVRRLAFIPWVHRATHRISLWLDSDEPRLEVSQGEAHLLAHLGEAGSCSVGDLHRAFAHKRSSLTSYLDRLEARGYVSRSPHPKDRRSFLVSLTTAGAAIAARVHRRLAVLETAAFHRLGARDVQSLRTALEALEDVGEARVQPARKRRAR